MVHGWRRDAGCVQEKKYVWNLSVLLSIVVFIMICGLTLKAHDFPESQNSFHSVVLLHTSLHAIRGSVRRFSGVTRGGGGAGFWSLFLSYNIFFCELFTQLASQGLMQSPCCGNGVQNKFFWWHEKGSTIWGRAVWQMAPQGTGKGAAGFRAIPLC